MRRIALVALGTAALLAVPTTALAHPAFNPSSIPAGQAVEGTLVIPHGCAPDGGMPDMAEEGAETVPTVELAVQQQEGVMLTPGDVDGWDVADDGEAWVWTDAGGATTDVIEFPVTIMLADGAAEGDRFYLKAFQACSDGSAFQWIGTPDDDAEFPAVLLEASAGSVGEAEMDDDMEMDHSEMDMDDESMDDEMGDASMDEDMDMADDETDEELAADEAATEDDGLPVGVLALLAVAIAGLVIGFVAMRRNA